MEIEDIVDSFSPENKDIDQILELFDAVLDSLYVDSIYNRGRFIVLEKFTSRIIERSTHVNTVLLAAILKDRIKSYNVN
jgi:hypothetical protein